MTDDGRFHVVLTGDLLGGADTGRVTANLARLFKMPEDKARQLLAGGPRVVKKDVDEATARKFQVALRQAGARCELKPVSPPPPAAASDGAGPGATTTAPEAAQESADLETVGTIRTGGAGFTGAFKVAPVGADLDPGGRPEPDVVPDVSHLSLAEPGADIETLKSGKPPVDPDISHLSIVEE